MTPLSCHGSLQVAGALMAFKCLTRAHREDSRPHPQLRMIKGEFHPVGLSLLRLTCCRAFKVCQRVALARTYQLPPQPFACSLKLSKKELRTDQKRKKISQESFLPLPSKQRGAHLEVQLTSGNTPLKGSSVLRPA